MKLVFVSSTFRDMQYERDALNTRVVPRINHFLERYSETVHFGDLRWGVNTTELESEESSKKVLKVCLDQIDDCKPYMIIFIGERYGWIPSSELLHGAALLKGMDVSAIKEDTSVTELEIEYGALLNPDFEGRVLFYFRNPFDMSQMSEEQRADYVSESPLHRAKVEQLKAQIREKYPDYIRYYDVTYDAEKQKLVGLEPLMDQIYSDLQRIFDIDLTYLNSLSHEERALSNSENHFNKMAQNSYFRKLSSVNEFDYDAFEYYNQMRFENNPAFEVIQGPHGVGSKTLVAQKYVNTLKAGYNAVCFSFGMDEFTDTTDKMVAAFCYKLEELMEVSHKSEATIEYFASLCNEYTCRNELPYIYFFAVNLPYSALRVFNKLAVLYPYLFGIGFCVHFRRELPEYAELPFFLKNRILHVPMLSSDEIGEMVIAILRSKRKELPPIVIDEIKKHSAANHPLYLSLLVERLLILDSEDFAAIRARGDGMDNINAYMIDLIRQSGDNVTEIARELLAELAERINPVMIPHLVSHIALPNHFKEDYIQEFFTHQDWNYSSLDYTLFRKTFPSLVYRNTAGSLVYTNDEVLAAARLLSQKWGTDKDISDMMAFIDTKPMKETIKARMILYRYLGDADSFVHHYICHMDGAAYKEDKAVAERCLASFHSVMTEEIYKNSDFATSVARLVFNAIAEESLNYPYDIAAYFLQCIPSYSDEATDINKVYEFLLQLEEHLTKLRESCSDEVLAFSQWMLWGSYMLPMLTRMTVPKAKQEGPRISSCMKNVDTQRVLQIIWEKKLPLVDVLNRSSTEMFRLFAPVLNMEEPLAEPMFHGLYHQCEGLEKYLKNNEAEQYAMLLKGKFDNIPEKMHNTYSMFLVMWGFCCYKTGDVQKAKKCYNAFYLMFDEYFKKVPPKWWDRAVYISAVKNYCHYMSSHEKQKTLMPRFKELFDWCLSQMVEPPVSFETVCEIAELQKMAYDKGYLESSTKQFFPIMSLMLSQAPSTMLAPITVIKVIEYYTFFSSLLNDNERWEYYIELMSRLMKGMMTDPGWEAYNVTELISECTVDFCLVYGNSINELVEKVISRVAEEHPDVFMNDKDEYIAAGMQICIHILEEKS